MNLLKGGLPIIPKDKSDEIKIKGFQDNYKLFYPRIFKQLLYLTGTKDIAEELAQETFIKLYTSPPAKEENLPAWLSKVAANLTYNFFRSEKRRKRREERETIKQMQGVVPLEESILRQEEVRLVRECLEVIPDRERLALSMKFSGYSYREIAETLELKDSSVGTTLARAQKKFLKVWQTKGGVVK